MKPNLKSPRRFQFDLKRLFTLLLIDLKCDLLDCTSVKNRVKGEGIAFLTKTLPLLAKALDRALADGFFSLPSNFQRKWRNSQIPELFGSLFLLVVKRNGEVRDDASIEAITAIRQICLFAYKAKFAYKHKDKLKVLSNFISTDQEVGHLRFSASAPLLGVVRGITQSIFKDFVPALGRHGPGVTSNKPVTEKNVGVLTPFVNLYDWCSEINAFQSIDNVLISGFRDLTYSTTDYFRQHCPSKVILVPKDSRGPRLISCEPAELQFAQQGVMKRMVSILESHPLTSGQVNFTDQTINRNLALEGSVTRFWATLDLKDASDRVSWSLVREIFRDSDLLPYLAAVRSSITLVPAVISDDNLDIEWSSIPNDVRFAVYFALNYARLLRSEVTPKLVKLHKHAPMGSATCFPVMAYVIFILIYTKFLQHGIKPDLAARIIFVYGDDIVVPSELVSVAIEALQSAGLSVNEGKSFSNSHFCESCGIDAYRGNDVTPVRLRIGNSSARENAHDVASALATANALSSKGYTLSSMYLYRCVEDVIGLLPFGTSESAYLCKWVESDRVRSYNLELFERFNCARRPKLQASGSYKFRAFTLESLKQKTVEDGAARLRRILPLMGQDIPLPKAEDGFWYMDLPRSVKLTKRTFEFA